MGTWHDEMDKAVAARKKAIAGKNRWTGKLEAAEARIEELSAQRAAVEADPIPVAAHEEQPQLDSGLRPIFGVTSQTVNAAPADYPIVIS